MIDGLIKLGNRKLNGDYSKENILKKISIKPSNFLIRKDSKTKPTERVPAYPLILDFNLRKKEVKIRRGPQFKKEYEYFIFPKMAPNSKRISFNTNTFHPHIMESKNAGPTPFGVIQYSKKKSLKLSNEFKACLEELKSFYVPGKIKKGNKSSDGFVLNHNLLDKTSRENFHLILNKNSSDDKKGHQYQIQKAYEELIPQILGRDSNIKAPIFSMIYINGENIFNTKFAGEYKEIIYYGYIKDAKFDNKNVKEKRICYNCKEAKNVTNNVQTSFKFYNLDKPGFFENLSQNNAYKSFSLCEKCYVDLLSGINVVKTDLQSQFMGIRFVMIPKSEEFFKDFRMNSNYLKEIVESEMKRSSSRDLKQIISESIRYNYLIDFLFYKEEKSSFKVIKSISDVEFRFLVKIKDFLDKINYKLGKEFPLLNMGNINLSTFYSIFLSNFEKNTSRYILVDIINAIHKLIPIEAEWFFENVLSNYKKGYFDDKKRKNGYFITFKALFLYEFLIELDLIEVNKMEMEVYSEIRNKDLNNFFEKHKEIDEFRKGLVILGILANRIARKQHKDSKSSTFLSKINYDGTDKTDLMELLPEIENYFKNYKELYNEPDLKTFAFETTSKYIKGSNYVSPQEISFYILLGVNLDKYFGIQYSKNKENEGDENAE